MHAFLARRFVDDFWSTAKRHRSTDLVIEDEHDEIGRRIRTRDDVLRDPSTPEAVKALLNRPARVELSPKGFAAWLISWRRPDAPMHAVAHAPSADQGRRSITHRHRQAGAFGRRRTRRHERAEGSRTTLGGRPLRRQLGCPPNGHRGDPQHTQRAPVRAAHEAPCRHAACRTPSTPALPRQAPYPATRERHPPPARESPRHRWPEHEVPAKPPSPGLRLGPVPDQDADERARGWRHLDGNEHSWRALRRDSCGAHCASPCIPSRHSSATRPLRRLAMAASPLKDAANTARLRLLSGRVVDRAADALRLSHEAWLTTRSQSRSHPRTSLVTGC
jgi:hypothetical protein